MESVLKNTRNGNYKITTRKTDNFDTNSIICAFVEITRDLREKIINNHNND